MTTSNTLNQRPGAGAARHTDVVVPPHAVVSDEEVLRSCWTWRHDLPQVVVDGELFVYNPITDVVTRLDQIGTGVVASLLPEASLRKIATALSDEYDVPLHRVLSDVLQLVRRLEAARLTQRIAADLRPAVLGHRGA